MGQEELTGRYSQLRLLLDAAYARPVWHAPTIDAIVEQLLSLERALGAFQSSTGLRTEDLPRWK